MSSVHLTGMTWHISSGWVYAFCSLSRDGMTYIKRLGLCLLFT